MAVIGTPIPPPVEVDFICEVDDILLLLGIEDTVTDAQTEIITKCRALAEGAIRQHLKYDPRYKTRVEFYPQKEVYNGNSAGIWEVNESQAYLRQEGSGGSRLLQVQHIPIRVINGLFVDYDGRFGKRAGSFGVDTELVEGEDFWPHYDVVNADGDKICRDGLIENQGSWPTEAGSIKISYAAGYTDDDFSGVGDLVDTLLNAAPIKEVACDETIRRVKKVFTRRGSARVGLGGSPLASETLGDYSYSVDTKILSSLVGGTSSLLAESVALLEPFVNWGFTLEGG